MSEVKQILSKVVGMNRQRRVGNPSPDDLWDLVNGYVDKRGRIVGRPGLSHPYNAAGSARAACTFPSGTVGMIRFNGKFHTFHHNSSANGGDSRIVVNVLRHPTGGAATLSAINSVFPFLNRLYVVATFSDDVRKHYWLDEPLAWTATTGIPAEGRVQPTVPSGFYFANIATNSDPAWQANVEVTTGDFKTPTVFTGFKYEATATTGTLPRTGNTEPTWPTVAGDTVIERRYITESQTPPGDDTPGEPPPGDPGPPGGGGYPPFPRTGGPTLER